MGKRAIVGWGEVAECCGVIALVGAARPVGFICSYLDRDTAMTCGLLRDPLNDFALTLAAIMIVASLVATRFASHGIGRLSACCQAIAIGSFLAAGRTAVIALAELPPFCRNCWGRDAGHTVSFLVVLLASAIGIVAIALQQHMVRQTSGSELPSVRRAWRQTVDRLQHLAV